MHFAGLESPGIEKDKKGLLKFGPRFVQMLARLTQTLFFYFCFAVMTYTIIVQDQSPEQTNSLNSAEYFIRLHSMLLLFHIIVMNIYLKAFQECTNKYYNTNKFPIKVKCEFLLKNLHLNTFNKVVCL